MHAKHEDGVTLAWFVTDEPRSELAALGVDDVQFHSQGVELLVRKSKTDQTGRGQTKVSARPCPSGRRA